MATEYQKKADEIKAAMRTNAEKLVKEAFPIKITELQKLFESDKFSYKRLDEISTDLSIGVTDSSDLNDLEPSTKKRKFHSINHSTDTDSFQALVPINKHVLELTEIIKPHIRDLVEHANMVKMWITFNIPRIEDGNNFGVSVQEDTMAEARQVETEAASYMDQITRYYISRGKLLSKVAKYPQLEDYRHVIVELDQKEFMSLRLVVAELRNNYCSLHDVILKNLEKINKPRSSNTENMF